MEHFDFAGVEPRRELRAFEIEDPPADEYRRRLQERVTELNVRRSAELTQETFLQRDV